MEKENLELEGANSVTAEPALEQASQTDVQAEALEQAEAVEEAETANGAGEEPESAGEEPESAAALAAAEEKGYQRGLEEARREAAEREQLQAQRREAERRMSEPDLWAVAGRAGEQTPSDADGRVTILNELPPCVWDL